MFVESVVGKPEVIGIYERFANIQKVLKVAIDPNWARVDIR